MDSRAGLRTTDWKTTKVGSAYLFEKPQSGGRKMPRLSDITDDDDAELKLCPTSKHTPNSSRKRRALRTDNVETLQDCQTCQDGLEDIKLVRDSKNDWKEIWSLGHTLAFETLRTTLLILLVIVRLGAAWAKHVEEWLDEEGFQRVKSNAKNSTVTETTLRADLGTVDSIDSCKPKTDGELNLSDNISANISDDISDFTDPTVNLTDRTKLTDSYTHFADFTTDPTDCMNYTDGSTDFTDFFTDLTDRTELTDVRKRLMSDSENLLCTTFPQLEASAPLVSST